MDVVSFIVPALVGLGIGLLSGLLGIGGGTILVPVFRLGFGMSAIASTATSLFTIIPTSVSGAVSHLRRGTCVPSLGIAAGLGGALTSPVGVWLASISAPWMVMVAAAVIIGYSAVNMLSKAVKMKPKPKGTTDVCQASTRGSSEKEGARSGSKEAATKKAGGSPWSREIPRMTKKQLATGALIGLGAGVASGYVGVGGGFIMVPLMLSLVGIPMTLASGTSLIAVMILAIPGVVEQGLLGNIDYLAGIAIALGSIPGALIGARLVSYVPERTLRFLFGGFLIVGAVVLALSEFGILG